MQKRHFCRARFLRHVHKCTEAGLKRADGRARGDVNNFLIGNPVSTRLAFYEHSYILTATRYEMRKNTAETRKALFTFVSPCYLWRNCARRHATRCKVTRIDYSFYSRFCNRSSCRSCGINTRVKRAGRTFRSNLPSSNVYKSQVDRLPARK